MDVQVMKFEVEPDERKIATLWIRYDQLILNCDLVLHLGEKKLWVRMPEIWKTKTKKISFIWWPTQEISNTFQKLVLNELFDNYDVTYDKLAEIWAEARKKFPSRPPYLKKKKRK